MTTPQRSVLASAPLEADITAVLNQLWHRWHDKPGSTSSFCDAILDLYQMGEEHRFRVNAYAYKLMKDRLISYIAKFGQVAS